MGTSFTFGKTASFLLLAFGISWTIAILGAFLGVRSVDASGYLIMAALFMLGPAAAAIVRLRLIDRGPWSDIGLRIEGTKWASLFTSMGLGVCIVPLVLLVIHLLGDGLGISAFGHAALTSERMIIAVEELLVNAGGSSGSGQVELLRSIPAWVVLLLALIAAVVAACSINLPFMLGEELGWRGYLWQCTSSWSGAGRCLFTGTFWGLWHAPLIIMGHNYPGYPVVGIGMMVVFCVLLAFLFDHARVRSGSIWAPAVLHGIINGSAGVMVLFTWDGHVLFGSVVGLAAFIALVPLVAAVIIIDGPYRRHLWRGNGPAGMA